MKPKINSPGDEEHWDEVYRSKKTRALSWYQHQPQVSLDFINQSTLAADDPIIDAGGGASSLAGHLLEQGFRDLSVLDFSVEAIQKNQRWMGHQAERIKWITADVRSFRARRQYALWHDRALFHFMTSDADRRLYMQAMQRAVKPGGQAIIATFGIDGPLKCSGLDTLQCDAGFLMKELSPGFCLIDERDEYHLTPGGSEQKFSWFHLKRRKNGD